MTSTTGYGTWTNQVDRANPTVEDTVSAVMHGDTEWAVRMWGSGAFKRLCTAYRSEINAALPTGVALCGNEFIGPHPRDRDLDIACIVESVDLKILIENFDVDLV